MNMTNKKHEVNWLSGTLIDAAIDKAGLTNEQVGEKAACTGEMIRKYRRGLNIVSVYHVAGVAKALGLNLNELSEAARIDRVYWQEPDVDKLLGTGRLESLIPIERLWGQLSEQHRDDLVSMAKIFAKQDR